MLDTAANWCMAFGKDPDQIALPWRAIDQALVHRFTVAELNATFDFPSKLTPEEQCG